MEPTPSVAPTTVTVGAAARLVSRGETTIRDWVKKGLVYAERDSHGVLRIERNSLLGYAAAIATDVPAPVPAGATRSRFVGAVAVPVVPTAEAPIPEYLRELISVLKEDLNRERREKDALLKRNDELQSEILKLMAEMNALLAKPTDKDGLISRWIRK